MRRHLGCGYRVYFLGGSCFGDEEEDVEGRDGSAEKQPHQGEGVVP